MTSGHVWVSRRKEAIVRRSEPQIRTRGGVAAVHARTAARLLPPPAAARHSARRRSPSPPSSLPDDDGHRALPCFLPRAAPAGRGHPPSIDPAMAALPSLANPVRPGSFAPVYAAHLVSAPTPSCPIFAPPAAVSLPARTRLRPRSTRSARPSTACLIPPVLLQRRSATAALFLRPTIRSAFPHPGTIPAAPRTDAPTRCVHPTLIRLRVYTQ